MRLYEFYNVLLEKKTSELQSFKNELLKRLKDLPDDRKTLSALKEIEELLNAVHAGGRVEYVNAQLKNLQDPDVEEAQRVLARYILSLDADPEDRQAMLKLWSQDDGLVNISQLLTPGVVNYMPDVIRGYDNPAIKEFSDELFEIEGYGKGKGEFALSIMSRRINLPAKGDLMVTGYGGVELKAESAKGGRFVDQEVFPKGNYATAANQISAILKDKLNVTAGKTGINLRVLVRSVEALSEDPEFDNLKNLVKELVSGIFFSVPAGQRNKLVNAILAGDEDTAHQLYTDLSYENYTRVKTEDKGVLFIRLNVSPYEFLYATSVADIKQAGMKLSGLTIYPIVSGSDVRGIFPQITLRPA